MKFTVFFFSFVLVLSACKSGTDTGKVPPTKNVPIESELQTAKEDLSSHPGNSLFMTHCLPCHQADGNGVPGMYPTLHNTKWVNGDNETLISIVIHGLDEEIEVDGESFKLPMAALPHLKDQEVADVLNFVRKKYGSSEVKISAGEVAAVRSKS